MGRRSFKRLRRRGGGNADSSRKSLECSICHVRFPLNEYKAHISKCREQSSNDKSNSENEDSVEAS
jgi:hypothetical protein